MIPVMRGLKRYRPLRLGLTLFLMLSALTAVWPALAQDGEDYPLIFGHNVEVIFPAALRFIVGVNAVPEDIESLRLLVSQENGPERTFTVDPVTAVIPELSGGVPHQFLVTWWLDADLTPVPFEKMRYRWELTVRGKEPVTAFGEFVYADSRHGPWRAAGQPPLILHWHNPNLGGQLVWEEIMAAYSLLQRQTGESPLFQFVIYDPQAELCEELPDPETGEMRQGLSVPVTDTVYPCSAELFARVYARSGMTFVQRPTFGLAELENLLIERMARDTYRRLWGEAAVPAWFETGLSMLYRLQPGIGALELVRTAARADALFPLTALQTPLAGDMPYGQRALWSAQGYTLVLALASLYGEEAPFALARAVTDDPAGFEGALGALTGGDQAALWAAWERWLFSDDAGRAATWTPYQPSIPTPTPTPTASPVPPTLTPSLTRTPSVTPTERVLGVPQPPVRIQTITPTRQGTATNTPLPPGSLPPATVPAPSSGGDRRDQALLVVGAGVVGVLAGALLALWRTRRR
jgi:hypothetical protein